MSDLIKTLKLLFQKNNNVYTVLQNISGLGQFTVKNILKILNLTKHQNTNKLIPQQVKRLIEYIQNFSLNVYLQDLIRFNITKLRQLECYRGYRRMLGLPLRGQRTHVNRFTARRLWNVKNHNRNSKKYYSN